MRVTIYNHVLPWTHQNLIPGVERCTCIFKSPHLHPRGLLSALSALRLQRSRMDAQGPHVILIYQFRSPQNTLPFTPVPSRISVLPQHVWGLFIFDPSFLKWKEKYGQMDGTHQRGVTLKKKHLLLDSCLYPLGRLRAGTHKPLESKGPLFSRRLGKLETKEPIWGTAGRMGPPETRWAVPPAQLTANKHKSPGKNTGLRGKY